MRRPNATALLIALSLLLAGCGSSAHVVEGAAVGAGAGAAVGALTGAGALPGALIGGGVGTVGGLLLP